MDLPGLYIVVQAVEDGAIFFREVGWGYPWVDKRWVPRARGLRMQDQPDYLLGNWIAEAYRDAAAAGVPRLDDIDAITATTRLGRLRIRYSRLIVPVETRWGDRCLLGACHDPGIDLRGVHA